MKQFPSKYRIFTCVLHVNIQYIRKLENNWLALQQSLRWEQRPVITVMLRPASIANRLVVKLPGWRVNIIKSIVIGMCPRFS